QLGDGGIMLPSISKLHVHDDAMAGGSPHGSYSPTTSPSPPVNQRDMARNSISYVDSPRMSDTGYVQSSLRAPAGRMDDMGVSHSMPSRVMEHWGNSSNGNGSLMPKRRRDYGGGPVVLTPPSMAAANPNSPRGGFSSPPGQAATLHHSHHHPYHPSQRTPRSPQVGGNGSAARPNLSGNLLPPISQFVQPGSTPMLSPPATSGMLLSHATQSQHQHQQEPSPNSRYADGPAAANEGVHHVDTNQICYLREENAQLRSRLQRLEQTVMQKQAEMQDWMNRVEQYIMRPSEPRTA
ncbi:hypothetical protein EC988_003182, partial [Linderina pennispora]